MKLYHGSNQIIRQPNLLKGRRFLDFGSGFYLSDEKSQAENRAKSAVLFFEEGTPTVNVFEWEKDVASEKTGNTVSVCHREKSKIHSFYR